MLLNSSHELHPAHLDASRNSGKVLIHQYFENRKSKAKSKASFHLMEFLTRVFSEEGASRFFKTFLLRFLTDSSNSSGDDSLRSLSFA